MLIQRRHDRLRLIEQHEHGLISGELAAAWRADDAELPRELVLATALHDLAWRELDEEPRWNPETRLPHDFLDFPPEAKYEAAVDAIDRLEELHPYAAVLVSLHYSSFGSPGRPPEFEEVEEERRLELLSDLDDEAPSPSEVRRHLDLLRLFDNLSLFLCLTSPGAEEGARPRWLTEELLRVPGSGDRIDFEWRDEASVVVRPFCFGNALELEILHRDLPLGPFDSPEALAEAWRDGVEQTVVVRLSGS